MRKKCKQYLTSLLKKTTSKLGSYGRVTWPPFPAAQTLFPFSIFRGSSESLGSPDVSGEMLLPSPTLKVLPFHVPSSSVGSPLLAASGTESLNGQSRKVVSVEDLSPSNTSPTLTLSLFPDITIPGQSQDEKKCPSDRTVLGMDGWTTLSTVGSRLQLSNVSTTHLWIFMSQDKISIKKQHIVPISVLLIRRITLQ